MSKTKQTDNANLAAKLTLRRYFIDKYHADSGLVFDCCQGSGVIWKALTKDYPHLRYFGVDEKPKAGRLKIDSARLIEAIPSVDVYDVDTYGCPVDHFQRILKIMRKPTTVFLTWGRGRPQSMTLSKEGMQSTGIPARTPKTLIAKAFPLIREQCCSLPLQHDILIREAVEAPHAPNCWYYGFRLEPKHGEHTNG